MGKFNKQFFKDIWSLSKGFWTSEEKWKAIILFVVIISIQIIYVSIMVNYNEWQKNFYNSIQAVDQDLFFYYLKFWPMYMAVYVFLDINRHYLVQKLEIMWRTWLVRDYVERWLSHRTYYMMKVSEQFHGKQEAIDNPDQRITDDIRLFINYIIQLTLGISNALMKLSSFGVVLWNISGIVNFSIGNSQVLVHGYMVWIAIFYAIAGSIITLWGGKPLIGLNYRQQEFEANFRFGLARLREYYESIAFYNGETKEKVDAMNRFHIIRDNFYRIMSKERFLGAITESHFRLGFLFPFLVGVPRVFSGDMQFGGLMQTANAFQQVEASLSFLVLRYYSNTDASIAQLQTVVARLMDFTAAMDEAKVVMAHNDIERIEGHNKLAVVDLQVERPDGVVLVKDLSIDVEPKENLLIMGASGLGKSTLLKALSGIWPYGKGRVECANKALFLPQKSYLPIGSLRDAILYPFTIQIKGEIENSQKTSKNSYESLEQDMLHMRKQDVTDEEIHNVFRLVGLGHFTDALDKVDTWGQVLSMGEQQRLAFAKVLIHKPNWLFLDEATSALDESNEDLMYTLVRTLSPHTTVISVAHRPRLTQYHSHRLRLLGDGRWEMDELSS